MTSTAASSSMPASESDDLNETSKTYLEGFAPERVEAIVAEARRMRERLSTIPWYAKGAAREGTTYWLRLAISYRGEA